MMSIDKSSEPNAKAALLKLKEKEQEVERKARKQFKGLFDKKPGEISEAGVIDVGDQITAEAREIDDQDQADSGPSKEVHEGEEAPQTRMGILAKLWSSSRKLFTALGAKGCTIL